jgi:transposase
MTFEDGRVEIVNHRVENAIRPTAVGKCNWLFMGEAGAGQRGAILYTVVESCRRQGLDPHAYLKDILTRLPAMTTSQLQEIRPAAWANARKTLHKLAA